MILNWETQTFHWPLELLGIFSIFYSVGLESISNMINFEIFDFINFLRLGAGTGLSYNKTIGAVTSNLNTKFIDQVDWRVYLVCHCVFSIICAIGICLLFKETRGHKAMESMDTEYFPIYILIKSKIILFS